MSNVKKIENLVIPPPPIPSMVRMSMVTEPPPPVPKEGSEEIVVSTETQTVGPELNVIFTPLEVGEKEAKGTIVIRVFENSPYETDFEGAITGVEVDMAWKAMMKGYRLWKNRVFKQLDTQNKEIHNA
jgi:hypothetical protein